MTFFANCRLCCALLMVSMAVPACNQVPSFGSTSSKAASETSSSETALPGSDPGAAPCRLVASTTTPQVGGRVDLTIEHEPGEGKTFRIVAGGEVIASVATHSFQPRGDVMVEGFMTSDAGEVSCGKVNVTIIVLDPARQAGKKFRACFAYDKVKIGKHKCNFAVFDAYVFDEKLGRINLNNYPSGDSVEGGKFDGTWDASGQIKVGLRCALMSNDCHKDVTFLSIVGEVEDDRGNKRWLRIDQGRIAPDTDYRYRFTDFVLSDREIDFGPLCETFVK